MMIMINMTIPDTCSECRLSVRLFGKLYCPYLDGRVGNEGKDSRCPLVEVWRCNFCDMSLCMIQDKPCSRKVRE